MARVIVVSPRSQVERLVGELRPERFVSLRSPEAQAFEPEGIAQECQLHLVMNDVAEDQPGLVSPRIEQVRELIAFGRDWNGGGAHLVHCYAGISRSIAAAFILAVALQPEKGERPLAEELRALSPMATPNPFLVRLADTELEREGRMVEAIRGIGRGAEAFEGVPFRWDV